MSSENLDDKAIVAPNTHIFPPYCTNKKVIGHPKLYTPQELLTRITEDANAVDYIGEIQITRIFYYKEKSIPEHEFLVFKVEATDRRFVNYIKIDRSLRAPEANREQNQPENGDANPSQDTPPVRPTGSIEIRDFFRFFSSLNDPSYSFGGQNAHDMIHVCDSQGLDSLTGHKYTLLGEIKVPTESPGQRLTLERLIVLALFVSYYQPQYRLLVSQCYWYAYTIWKLLLAAFPDTVKFDGELRGAGRNGLLPTVDLHKQKFEEEKKYDDAMQVTEVHRHAELAAKYLESWSKFEGGIPSLQAKYGAKAKEALAQQEKQRVEDENKRLEEKNKRDEEERRRVEEENKRLEEKSKRDEEERQRAEEERQRAEEERQRAEEERRRVEEDNKRLEEKSKRDEEERQRAEEERRRVEEVNKRLEEKSKQVEEENKRLEEKSQRDEEERRRVEEENKRLQEMIAELRAKNTAI